MFSDIFQLILRIGFLLLGTVLILRIWTHAVRLHPFNPYAQAILRLSNWLVQPIQRLAPPGRLADWPALLACWLTALVYLVASWLVLTGTFPPLAWMAAVLPAAALTVLEWTFNVVLWVTLIQAILSWVNPMAPIMPVVQVLTAPLLNPIRRILPHLGGIDFSPLILLVLAQIMMRVVQRMVYALAGV